ncbi:MAG: biotin carboxylase, partial [SAR324 cluster bacterium]|nr:biotin carboxylase [SAR324 cluster bacterium]
ILLSEKDSVVYSRALAPELRAVGRNERVHRIPDYGGINAEEKEACIGRILEIAHGGGYTHVFAGYGFMAEDHEFVRAVEEAGLGFVGPSSRVALKAGAKDAAKALARTLGISVTPGIDNVAALALLAGAPAGGAESFLEGLARKHGLEPDTGGGALPPEERAERILAAAGRQGIELVTLEALQAEAERQVTRLLKEHPGHKLRFKHVSGGGGKGQRVIASSGEAPQAVFEVLSESKATGPGDNKNFLIEVNVENTRHNEIQLLGNGEWCIALGGRDCSLQMHEQKLVEISITQELLEATAAEYAQAGKATQAEVLRTDLELLRQMETQAERFGEAVALDSASTFESIVFGDRHYFMEMNTRIQVEHRVTEMVYGLRFAHPDRPGEFFQMDSLVGAMLLLAVHGDKLPRPERVPRHASGAEVRINATNDALRPHAGGIVLDWTPPLGEELRDDQGIGIPNPDTGHFMPYQLAGAYDSNAALIVTHGTTRADNLHRMAEILRQMEVRGKDVMSNQAFLYGLTHWMIGCDPMIKPATPFVRAYLAAVGALAEVAREIDPDLAWRAFGERAALLGAAAAQALAAKQTLILRPLRILLGQPHLLAGWLAPRPERRWEIDPDGAVWLQNPFDVVEQLYHYLFLEERPGAAPGERIWDHDRRLLDEGLAFYREAAARLGIDGGDWPALEQALESEAAPKGIAEGLWARTRAAHRGFQHGLPLLKLPIVVGQEAGFYGLTMDERLEPVVPAPFLDEARVSHLHAALAPPPAARANEILAWTGGTFYARPSPDAEPYVTEGSRFAAGDTMGILEVMKMFNPIRAEFGGTVTRVLAGDTGVIVHKGQRLFEVEPDETATAETPEEAAVRRRERTLAMLERL